MGRTALRLGDYAGDGYYGPYYGGFGFCPGFYGRHNGYGLIASATAMAWQAQGPLRRRRFRPCGRLRWRQFRPYGGFGGGHFGGFGGGHFGGGGGGRLR